MVLYLTYRDLRRTPDLMMLAVPEALAGGAFFLFLFPKLLDGWESPPLISVAVWVGFIACSAWPPRPASSCSSTCAKAIEKSGGLETSHRWKNCARP